MIRKRKMIGWIVVLSLFVITLSSYAAQGEKEQITLRFLHRYPDAPYKSFLEEMIAEYEQQNPSVKIEVQAVHNDPYKEKIKIVLGSTSVPDIFFSWSGEFLYRFIREGKIYDFTKEFNQDSAWKESLMPAQVAPFTYKGGLYGLPFLIDAKAFFYNKKIFADMNLEIPKTWDELIALCETVQKAGITPIAYGNSAKWPSSHYIGTLNQKLVAQEVRMKDYDPASGEFTDPGYVEALKRYQELSKYFSKFSNAVEHAMARQDFVNGNAAMMYLETIEVEDIASSAPPEFDYGMFAFPAIPEGKGNQNFITGAPEGFVVSASTKYPEEALKFLKYITGPEVGTKQAQAIQKLNGAKGVMEHVENEKLLEAYNVLVEAEGLAYWLDTDLHAKLVNVYLDEAQRLINNETTPEEMMEFVQKTAQDVQKEFQ